jgi:ecotropic viral integration site 5 protein
MKGSLSGMPSQRVSLLHPTASSLANPATHLKDQHASPLDALLSPTAPLPRTFPRDSVAGSDFGEVRLDDDRRFSTVSLNAAATRGSTVAIKSPIDEGTPKPWAEEEPVPAPPEGTGASVRASFLLQMLENDVASGPRRSLDGQQKLQEVFERAQRDSKDLEGEAAGVDWGECSPAAPVYTTVLMRV